MSDLPEYSVDDLEREPVLDLGSVSNDDAVDLGLAALEVIDERELDLAVRVVLRGDAVFVAKPGSTGPDNDPWLAGKAAVAERFGESSLLVKLRHLAAGTPFEERTDVDHDTFRAHGGSIPILERGVVVGSITTSGLPETIDHATSAEAVRRFLAARES